MREILFRAKLDERIDEWIKGSLWYDSDSTAHIIGYRYWGEISKDDLSDLDLISWKVIPKTIGQYTGLTDKNGKKIFEGDIVRALLSWDGEDVADVGRIFYSEELCGFYRTSKVFGDGCPSMSYTDEYEVIGNIYDNPELIGDTDNG